MEKTARYGWQRYFLLVALLSFLGWAFETVYIFLVKGIFSDRGFMSMPFCPIYGCSIVLTYLLLGTPDEGGLLFGKIENRGVRYPLYLLAGFVLSSAVELIVGLFFDRVMHKPLWDYSYRPYNLHGYICLRNSLIWAALLFVFIKFLFLPLKRLIGCLSTRWAGIFAWGLLLASILDVAKNVLATIF